MKFVKITSRFVVIAKRLVYGDHKSMIEVRDTFQDAKVEWGEVW